jgi:malate/lactate dehydrogenase
MWPRLMSGDAVRVCVTGAAGNIAYSLIFMIASGQLFGPKQKVSLHLLDIPPMAEALKGVEMEIADCAFPLVKGEILVNANERCCGYHRS